MESEAPVGKNVMAQKYSALDKGHIRTSYTHCTRQRPLPLSLSTSSNGDRTRKIACQLVSSYQSYAVLAFILLLHVSFAIRKLCLTKLCTILNLASSRMKLFRKSFKFCLEMKQLSGVINIYLDSSILEISIKIFLQR